jgi:hypothetical protein
MDNLTVSENTTSQEKVSKKSPLIKVIVPLLLLVVLGVLGFIFRDRILQLVFPKYTNSTPVTQVNESGESTFGSLLGDGVLGDIDFENLDSEFKEDIDPLIKSQGYVVNFDKQEDKEEYWVFGQIENINGQEIDILITKPDFLSTVKATYTCKEDKSILLAKENLTILATNINVSELIRPGYLIYTKCLKEGCTEIGDSCILVKMD